jgi:molecular chaperone GrpE
MATDDRSGEDEPSFVTESGKLRQLLRPADLEGEMDGVRSELLQERERHVRTLADFKNYRRRIEREGNRLAEAGKREMLLQYITLIDDLEKALLWTSGRESSLKEGLEVIRQKALAMLDAQEVRPFDSRGKAFTPDLHEAVALAEGEDVEQGTVIEELRRGYLWKNELLRAAQVRVAG